MHENNKLCIISGSLLNAWESIYFNLFVLASLWISESLIQFKKIVYNQVVAD